MKILHYISTALLCGLFLFSAGMYLMDPAGIAGVFESFNYPGYLVYPLAIAKILGVIAVVTDRSKLLREWAYAGFFFDAILAATAHQVAGDGEMFPALLAIVLVIVSRATFNHRYYN